MGHIYGHGKKFIEKGGYSSSEEPCPTYGEHAAWGHPTTKGDRANFLFTLLLVRPQGTKGGLQIREKPQNSIF